MHALSYTRFSTGTQAKGSSADRQTRMVNDWLAQHPEVEYHPDLSPEDLGISGYSGKHLDAGLGELLQAAETHKIGDGWYVLIEAYDRLGRLEPLDMLSILQQLIGAGVTLVTLEDGLEYSRATISQNAGLLFLVVGKVQQAHHYSETLSRRISASYTRRRQQASEGKRIKRRTPFWLDLDGELKQNEAEAVSGLFDRYLTGEGERRLLRWLQSQLDPCPVKEPSSIKRILKNRVAIGYWEEHLIYPPVVTEETFYRVQQAIGARVPKHVTAASKWLLSGIVKCGTCGKNGQIRATKGKQPQVLCGLRSRKGPEACSNSHGIPYLVADWIRAAHEIEFMEAQPAESADFDIPAMQQEVQDTESRIATAIEVLLDTPSKALKARLRALETELSQRTGELAAALQSRPALRINSVQDVLDGTVDMEAHNRALQAIGMAITWYSDGSISCGDHTYQYDGWKSSTGYRLLDADGDSIPLQIPVNPAD